MNLFDFFQKLARQQATTPASFTLPSSQLVDAGQTLQAFRPNLTYFEIRLKQMFLRDKREYWRGFRPISTFATRFIHNGEWLDVPFILGPDQLGETATNIGGDAIEYHNLRIAGPYPYMGDDLQLFSSLSRMEVNNWATTTLSFFETLVKTFDATKLSSYLKVAGPLVEGVESFLGMSDVELQIARLNSYEEPTNLGNLRPRALRSRFEVMLNTTANKAPPPTKFWVKDDRLFAGNSADTARPYQSSDFLLIEIRPLARRTDYTTFDFHKKYWKETRRAIVQGDMKTAMTNLRLTALSLVDSPDLIDPERKALIRKYRSEYDDYVAIANDTLDLEGLEGAQGFDSTDLPDDGEFAVEFLPEDNQLSSQDLLAELGL